MKKSKQIAVCGMLAALSIVFMFLGSILGVFTYVAPLLCSIIMAIICDVANKKYAFITYIAVSVISLIFLNDKECALTYAFFFGYYVIIKDKLEEIKPKWLCLLIKLLIFNAEIIASQLILIYAFGIPFETFWGKWGAVVLLLLANAVFFMYEIMLKRLIILYNVKYRNKVHKLLK